MGAVYVLSNSGSMRRGIHKVGYTTRTVEERVAELNASTSIPTKFKAEYWVYLEDNDARLVEQAAHKHLTEQNFHHAKEYFDCSLEDCKQAISKAIDQNEVKVIAATDAREALRLSAEISRQRADAARLKAEAAEHERKLLTEEANFRTEYQAQLDELSNPGGFLPWWIGVSIAALVGLSIYFPKKVESSLYFPALILGLAGAAFARNQIVEWKKNSQKYRDCRTEMERQVSAVRNPSILRTENKAASKMPEVEATKRFIPSQENGKNSLTCSVCKKMTEVPIGSKAPCKYCHLSAPFLDNTKTDDATKDETLVVNRAWVRCQKCNQLTSVAVGKSVPCNYCGLSAPELKYGAAFASKAPEACSAVGNPFPSWQGKHDASDVIRRAAMKAKREEEATKALGELRVAASPPTIDKLQLSTRNADPGYEEMDELLQTMLASQVEVAAAVDASHYTHNTPAIPTPTPASNSTEITAEDTVRVSKLVEIAKALPKPLSTLYSKEGLLAWSGRKNPIEAYFLAAYLKVRHEAPLFTDSNLNWKLDSWVQWARRSLDDTK